MSRLNSGVLTLNREWHDPGDLVGVVLKKLGKALDRHNRDLADELRRLLAATFGCGVC